MLLHAERSSLTVSGLTLDAAQTAMAALYADATGEQDTITVRESTLRNPSDLALIVSDASGQITVQNSRIEQQDPQNRAVGIHAMSSAGAGFLIADTSVSGFGHGAAEFVEWYRPDDATAQIRFERASLTGNGNASEENWTAAGGISLSQPSNVPVDPRLVVVDSTLSENTGRYAGGIAVSAASWGSAPGARVVEISGSTFSHNTSTADPGNPWMPSADDLMEMPLPSRAAAAAAPSPAPEHPFLADLAAEGHLELPAAPEPAAEAAQEEPAEEPMTTSFAVANSTFVGLVSPETQGHLVLNLTNPGSRAVFDHVTVLGASVQVGSWVDAVVFEMRDTVIDAAGQPPVDQPMPARAAGIDTAADDPEVTVVARSTRSAYVEDSGQGYPLIEGTDDVIVASSADLKLGTLANNGGPTQTVLPAAGSPLIDAGESGSDLAPDQRGISRPQGPRADIGSVEVEVTTPPTTTPPTTTPPTTTPPTTAPPTTSVPPTGTETPGTTAPSTGGPATPGGPTDPLAQTGQDAPIAPWALAALLSALLGSGILLARRLRAKRLG